MKKLLAVALTLTVGVVSWAFAGGLFAEDNQLPALPESSQVAGLAAAGQPPLGIELNTAARSGLAPSTARLSTGAAAQSSSPYAQHPRASLSQGAGAPAIDVPVLGSSYAFRPPGGRFTRVAPQVMPPLTISDWEQNRLPQISFSRQPAQLEIVITCAAERFEHRLTPQQAQAFPLLPGRTYGVRIIASYEGALYTGTVNFGYTIRTGELAVRFEVSGDTTDLGEALVLRVRNLPCDAPVSSSTSIPFDPVFFPDGRGGAIALLPVSIHVTPGEHFVELRAAGASARFPVRVLATEFPIQRFSIDTSIADRTVNSAAANEEYRRVIHPLREVSDPVQHWQGRFSYPVTQGEGRITSPFAVIRFVNGVGPSRHAAIDIALPEGTPTYAPAAGRVLFAGYLQLTGNTVAIEHGFGLKTWYYHFVSLDVQTGDMVRQGQRIGAVGTTGFSTGPHLHYGMSVFGVYINPDTATNTDIFNWD